MKKIILFTIIALFATNINAQRIKGSDTVLPLAQRLAEQYGKQGVTITGGGSGVGITSLNDNNCDIAMASRRIKFTEKSKLTKQGKKIEETVIGYDALAVIVNPSNKIDKLTVKQIEEIYTGVITNWKEVGGADIEIVVYARETSSGTYEFFKQRLLNRKNYMKAVLSMPATGAVIQSVSQTAGAIGYVGLAYLNDNVKATKISFDEGKSYVAPSFENAMNSTYQVVRPLYFYFEGGLNKHIDNFIEYTLSPEAQKIVLEVGYIPISKENDMTTKISTF